ncbi:diguanylate cyclase [Poseidonibacter lekithochrous]|uniref:diguanylate cyclase n=1 Tax=Poseidonibacter TaxID=2321187 RepID=UPI001C08D971|nr:MULTISPECIES: diguanylate cyclase [Poseidonibacter]MBU3015316.1 diguanylate cyclase [Poseidonibacter lekithochrous]MDO6828613.1 diguanylate cyclase [Poseidonibacter sp. 1_MG-2023]
MKKINKTLLSNITILYVEDEKMISEEVSFFFKRYVKSFHVANNGIEGLELFKKIKPDILISDIQMPKMDGLEMVEEIGNTSVPIIITTAYSDIDYFLKAIELKISKFVIKPINLITLISDVQDCVTSSHLQDKLFKKDNLLKIVDENVLISITDKDGIIVDVSSSFCEFTKYKKEELIGQTHNILKHDETPSSFYKNMWDIIRSGKVYISEIKNKKKDGTIYFVTLTITPVFRDGEIVNYTAIRNDITDKIKLEQLIIEDDLTKLYNRRHFNTIINQEIRRLKRDNLKLSLVSIDIDHFKKYNDTYGHPKGDDVLVEIGKVLKNHTSRATDYAFRMGGEEFCLIFSGLEVEESLFYVQEVVNAVENLNIEHKNSKNNDVVTISAGIVVQKASEIINEDTLYKYSDIALYQAKIKGRNQVILSDSSTMS